MAQFIIFLIIGIAGILAGYWLTVARKTKNAGLIARQHAQKEDNLRKVMELFRKKSQVSNDDIEKMLGISDATATNYLQALEDSGKIKQIGKEGRGVVYKLNG